MIVKISPKIFTCKEKATTTFINSYCTDNFIEISKRGMGGGVVLTESFFEGGRTQLGLENRKIGCVVHKMVEESVRQVGYGLWSIQTTETPIHYLACFFLWYFGKLSQLNEAQSVFWYWQYLWRKIFCIYCSFDSGNFPITRSERVRGVLHV